MTESVLINKYRATKYHELMLLLKRIKDKIAIRYDFESLLSNPHHYDDSFLDLIPFLVNTVYLFIKKDYREFVKQFYAMINIFEAKDTNQSPVVDQQVLDDMKTIFSNINEVDQFESVPPISIALFVLQTLFVSAQETGMGIIIL